MDREQTGAGILAKSEPKHLMGTRDEARQEQ
jgi:hypothetical protein